MRLTRRKEKPPSNADLSEGEAALLEHSCVPLTSDLGSFYPPPNEGTLSHRPQ
jgi:hypothetical protein